MTQGSRDKVDAPVTPCDVATAPQFIWEGVYRDFSEVPTSGPGFEGDIWTDAAVRKATRLMELAAKPGMVSEVVGYGCSVLPVVAALVVQGARRVRILDFGGGLGFTFLSVKAGLAQGCTLEYHVVEKPNICRSGEVVLKGHPEIRFHAFVPGDLGEVDIAHLGASLHYVQDWQGLLCELARLKPSYVLFTDLPAGDIETFATAQNYYGSRIAAWFFNINEIVGHMANQGFRLLFKAKYFGTYLGVQRECPQDNFPEHLRIGHTCMLLFGRG